MRKGGIKKLERALRLATPCPKCGWPPQDPGEIEIKVYWEDGGDPPPEDAPDENQYCESCGHPTYLIIEWTDLPDVEEFDPHRSEKLRQQRNVIEFEENPTDFL